MNRIFGVEIPDKSPETNCPTEYLVGLPVNTLPDDLTVDNKQIISFSLHLFPVWASMSVSQVDIEFVLDFKQLNMSLYRLSSL